MSNPIPGTVCCILCRGMVIYKDGDKSRFKNHMYNEHGAFFDIDYLLASCLMESEQKEAVAKTVNTKNGEYSSLLLRETSVAADMGMTLREETLDNVDKEDDSDEADLSTIIELKKEKVDEFDIDLKCVNCEVQFGTEDGYIQHERKGCKKEEVKKKNVECDVCGKYYTSKQSLRAHKDKYHNNEQNIKQERYDDPSMNPKLYPRFSSEDKSQVTNQEEAVFDHSNYEVNVSTTEEEFPSTNASESYVLNNLPPAQEPKQVLDQFLNEARNRNPAPNNFTPAESEQELDQLLSEVRKRNGDVFQDFADDSINSEVNEVHNKRDNSERFVCQVENCGKSYTVKTNRSVHEKKVHNIISTRAKNKKQKVVEETPPEENSMKWDDLEKIRAQYYNQNESDRRSVSDRDTVEEDIVTVFQQQSNKTNKLAENDLDEESKIEMSLSQSMSLNMSTEAIGNQSSNLLPGLDISMSKYFTRNPKVITSARGKSLSLFNEIPSGLSEDWKMRTFEVINNKTGDKQVIKHYLTPELKVLKTGLAVIEYLRLKEEMNPEELLEISTILNIPEKKLRSLTD